MASWAGESSCFQFQTLSLSGNVLSLEPLGSAVTLPAALGSSDSAALQALIDQLNARVAALDAYIRGLDSAIEIVGVAYTPPN